MKVSEVKTKICQFMSIPTVVDHQLYYDGALIEVKCIANKCLALQFLKVLVLIHHHSH